MNIAPNTTGMSLNVRCSAARPAGYPNALHSQRGVVLFIALIVLVAMSLAGIALVRSVDTVTVVAGNLAFKQSALQEADMGMEEAVAVLNGLAVRTLDNTGQNFYATPQPVTNNFGIPDALYSLYAPTSAQNTSTGNTRRYLIERMCEKTGAFSGAGAVNCSMISNPGARGGTAIGGNQGGIGDSKPYYRLTVRVDGPRNTVTYTQAMVYLTNDS